MHQSISKISKLPPATKIYCAHEYTLNNSLFALSVEPKNETLLKRISEFKRLRRQSKPKIPTTVGEELEKNPFMRAHSQELRTSIKMSNDSDVKVFAELRKRKDNF
jgi:hydroxyacylglutathione hydrolase